MALNANAERWVRELESGGYEQGTSYLHQRTGDGTEKFCCLGIACKLAAEEGVTLVAEQEWNNGGAVFFYGTDPGNETYTGDEDEREGFEPPRRNGYLPRAVREWLGLSEESGEFLREEHNSRTRTSLASMNDSGRPFSEIAAQIREEPPGLFAREDGASA